MKNIILLTLFLLCAGTKLCSAQDGDIYINEGETAQICGKYVTFDGIWLNNGVRIADISIMDNMNQKPITGGYKNHDTLKISDGNKCTYYIHDIYKKGIFTKGVIVISRSLPETMLSVMQGIFPLKDGDDIFRDKQYVISKIQVDKAGAPTVEIKITREDLDTAVNFQKGAVLWSEGFPLELTEISTGSGTCRFEEMKNYSYKTGDVIKGEDINKPPDGK